MERIFEVGTLLAHYGSLLTERQRTILQQAVWEDCSLSEIAEREGMTRQGVRDAILHGEKQLYACEEKMGLVKRFRRMEERTKALQTLIDETTVDLAREKLTEALAELKRALEEDDGV